MLKKNKLTIRKRMSAHVISMATCFFGIAPSVALGDCFVVRSEISNAIVRWQKARSVVLSYEVDKAVVEEFCESADEFQSTREIPSGRIIEAIDPTVTEFLDRSVDSQRYDASLSALLGQQLGVTGFASPLVKRWGSVKVTYSKTVDQMRIDGHLLVPSETYLVSMGSHELSGIEANTVVCEGDVEIRDQNPVPFNC